jgi:hypothetical protein
MILINLVPHSDCREYKAWHEYMHDPKESAVYEIPKYGDILDSFNSTKRNAFRQSLRKGYTSREITWPERTNYLNDIFEINTSKQVRQGKPLETAYQQQPKEITGDKTCEEHYGTFIGCFATDGKLRAYITTNFCGDLAAASQIMGHGEYLHDGIMVNIWHEFVRICIERKIKVIVYSRWEDGFDGLKSWKRSVGMKPEILKEAI